MSRSRRKSPIRGVVGARSEKRDKRNAHKALRQAERRAITQDLPSPRPVDVSDDWDFAKDGKVSWFGRLPRDPDVRRRLLTK
jgi:hypothetical protein